MEGLSPTESPCLVYPALVFPGLATYWAFSFSLCFMQNLDFKRNFEVLQIRLLKYSNVKEDIMDLYFTQTNILEYWKIS